MCTCGYSRHKRIGLMKHIGEIKTISFSPDGSLCVTGAMNFQSTDRNAFNLGCSFIIRCGRTQRSPRWQAAAVSSPKTPYSSTVARLPSASQKQRKRPRPTESRDARRGSYLAIPSSPWLFLIEIFLEMLGDGFGHRLLVFAAALLLVDRISPNHLG
jgi:hypothetical protein